MDFMGTINFDSIEYTSVLREILTNIDFVDWNDTVKMIGFIFVFLVGTYFGSGALAVLK